MKYVFLFFQSVIVLCMAGFNTSGQDTDHWETIIKPDNIFKYHTSNSGEPASEWQKPEFNDQNWARGKGGIGYGDNDDNTIINPCLSVCLRTTFSIIDKSVITDAILSIDYDDAFVAFLNGTEISRSAGLSGDFPSYNQVSTTNREAEIYQGGLPEDFLISNEKLKALLKDGENVLAIQVHNSSISSSDLSSIIYFSVGLSTDAKQYQATPDWFKVPVSFTSSNLPVFIIDTKGKQIVDEPKTDANLKIIYKGTGVRNYLSDQNYHYDGKIGIELRGNSTMGFPKKPYTFETRDEFGENLNVPLLGFPAENDWILRASYYDRTFIRNPLGHHLSRLMGHWSSGNKHCELILNGEYQGIYILVEKIKRTKNRLNLNKLKPDEISGEDLTGGYIYEVAGQHNDFGYNRRLRYPDFEEVSPEQLQYIKNYDDNFRNAMYTDYSNDPLAFYNSWIDLQTFLDFVLVQEVTRNPDGIGWSGYFHKDKGKPLCAGPVWDFDQSLSNSTFSEGSRTDLWIIDYKEPPNPPFWEIMLHEPYFENELKKRWFELRENQFKDEKLLTFVDSIANNLSESVVRNFILWPTLNIKTWREIDGYQQRGTYLKHVEHMKTFLVNRMEWMDNELNKITTIESIDSRNHSGDIKIYPNPAIDIITVDYTLQKPEYVSIRIYNSLGTIILQQQAVQSMEGNNKLKIQLNNGFSPGIYFVHISNGNTFKRSCHFIKSN